MTSSSPISEVRPATATKARVFTLVLAVVLFNAVGNLALAWGLRQGPDISVLQPLTYLRPMLNPAVAGGIALLVLWLLTRMALLSWADLSFVLPLTSVGYVLAAVLGHYFLHEVITPEHWIGIALIFCGTLIVGTTDGKTRAGLEPLSQ